MGGNETKLSLVSNEEVGGRKDPAGSTQQHPKHGVTLVAIGGPAVVLVKEQGLVRRVELDHTGKLSQSGLFVPAGHMYLVKSGTLQKVFVSTGTEVELETVISAHLDRFRHLRNW